MLRCFKIDGVDEELARSVGLYEATEVTFDFGDAVEGPDLAGDWGQAG